MKNLVVLGGTGFLGRHICLAGLNAGYSVTSLSSSGRLSDTTSFPLSSISQIRWQKADAFKPETYRHVLEDATAVVHTMGTIFDNPSYKQIITNPASVTSLMRFVGERLQGENPMIRGNTKSSFTRLNCDSALLLANETAKLAQAKRTPFVYISAADWNPMAERGYIESKRQAEYRLESEHGDRLRPVFMRPGFMYDTNDQQSLRGKMGMAARLASGVAQSSGVACLRQHDPAIPVQTVASAVIEAVADDTIEGALDLDTLQEYSAKMGI